MVTKRLTQTEMAEHFGIKRTEVVRALLKNNLNSVDKWPTSLDEWRLVYSNYLKMKDPIKSAMDERTLSLNTERAREARVRADIGMVRIAKDLNMLVNVSELGKILGIISKIIADNLDRVPSRVKIEIPEISTEAIDLITKVIDDIRVKLYKTITELEYAPYLKDKEETLEEIRNFISQDKEDDKDDDAEFHVLS